MTVSIAEKNNIKYLKAEQGQLIIRSEQDVPDILAEGYLENIQKVLLYSDNLHDSFFDLSTRQAGHIIQKFSNYRVQVALIVLPETQKSKLFTDWEAELNQGGLFRLFDEENKAVEWLLK